MLPVHMPVPEAAEGHGAMPVGTGSAWNRPAPGGALRSVQLLQLRSKLKGKGKAHWKYSTGLLKLYAELCGVVSFYVPVLWLPQRYLSSAVSSKSWKEKKKKKSAQSGMVDSSHRSLLILNKFCTGEGVHMGTTANPALNQPTNPLGPGAGLFVLLSCAQLCSHQYKKQTLTFFSLFVYNEIKHIESLST